MVTYNLLKQEEMDARLVDTLKAQQMDHFLHTTNLERFRLMLPLLSEGEFKSKIEGSIAETMGRLVEVEAIIAALNEQIPTGPRLEIAKAYLDNQL